MFATEGVENMERMHKSYETCEFPQNEARADFDPSFSTTVIYWKPLSEEETKEETKEEKGKGKEKEIVDDKDDEKNDEKKDDKDEDDLSKKLESTTISW